VAWVLIGVVVFVRGLGLWLPVRFEIWSGWDGVGTAAVTLVGPIAYFTRIFIPTTANTFPAIHYTEASLNTAS
jgi:hypothetical protein